ncbi:PaaI family thioesterase [Mycolicibacterium lacusdiani]|uniref:PaaI family thioesterase n=1 Tax=Mycolicibacterium lacusdiani TaxID=2895283 RepID=UPI001F351FD1|nr:PaaI family thioesterase [Mycolicibacterium lacusdiani]
MSPHALNTPIGRFDIDTLEEGPTGCRATMPIRDMVNPVTGLPSLASLAMLLDHIGGVVNFRRQATDEWTVSSELALEASPDAAAVIAAADDALVLGTSLPLGAKTATALAECVFRIGDAVIASGTVRSFYIESPETFAESPFDAGSMEPRTGLAAKASVGPARTDGTTVVLAQSHDRVLENTMGVVHGGVASAGLEMAASAAVNAGRTDDPLTTASLRVNFLRQFLAGDESRYEATPLRVGRRSGVADAQAVGVDGRVAITARLTAYRC